MTKVMIIDDDRTTVKLLQTLLELDDFEVSVAGRGADVMPLAEKVKPDIFLMDYHLSDMHGVEILRMLRSSAQFATTPVVVASGMDVSEEVMSAGANHFLIKPFEPDDLPPLFNKLVKG
ncbi:MAG: response regulator [Anaerolineae bacterium]